MRKEGIQAPRDARAAVREGQQSGEEGGKIDEIKCHSLKIRGQHETRGRRIIIFSRKARLSLWKIDNDGTF